jgi:hypothetical protein
MSMGGEDGNEGKVPPATAVRLAAVLAAYGANPSRWPKAERAGLERALASLPRDAVREADALDATLDRVPSAAASASLNARVLAGFDAAAPHLRAGAFAPLTRAITRVRDLIWPGAPLWQPVSALALSLIVGLVVGVLVPADVYAHGGDDLTASASPGMANMPLADLGQGS